jgi:arginase family enzyme
MNEVFTTSTANFFYFLVAGSVIVYLILKFDKINRQKLNKVLLQAQDVEPMLMKKAAQHKLHALKMATANPKVDRSVVAKQLDELVADYDKGHISLPDYCKKLNSLLAMTA